MALSTPQARGGVLRPRTPLVVRVPPRRPPAADRAPAGSRGASGFRCACCRSSFAAARPARPPDPERPSRARRLRRRAAIRERSTPFGRGTIAGTERLVAARVRPQRAAAGRPRAGGRGVARDRARRPPVRPQLRRSGGRRAIRPARAHAQPRGGARRLTVCLPRCSSADGRTTPIFRLLVALADTTGDQQPDAPGARADSLRAARAGAGDRRAGVRAPLRLAGARSRGRAPAGRGRLAAGHSQPRAPRSSAPRRSSTAC